jgi:hypothetical protein
VRFFFHKFRLCVYFDKKWAGQHFERFFSQTHLITLDRSDVSLGEKVSDQRTSQGFIWVVGWNTCACNQSRWNHIDFAENASLQRKLFMYILLLRVITKILSSVKSVPSSGLRVKPNPERLFQASQFVVRFRNRIPPNLQILTIASRKSKLCVHVPNQHNFNINMEPILRLWVVYNNASVV